MSSIEVLTEIQIRKGTAIRIESNSLLERKTNKKVCKLENLER